MTGVFLIAFLASLVGLVWGIIAPDRLTKLARAKQPLSRKRIGVTMGGLALIFFVLTGVTAPQQTQTAKTTNLVMQSLSKSQVKGDSISTKTVTETEPVTFDTKNQDDPSLAKGQTKVVQTGQNGARTLTYRITYTNDTQTDKTLVTSEITTPAVDQIVAVGTYVAPQPVAKPTPAPSPAPTPTPTPSPSCYPLTNGGNCYAPGQYCRNADHGTTGVAGNGTPIVCAYNNGWRWEPR
ncbi:MAG TPA: G5 domain-containing protein [Candidatus Saccharimonadales bacterium]